MNQDSDGVADLRRLVISLSVELEVVSDEVVRLMHRLDAYQMVLEGLSPTYPARQAVLREVDAHIERLARMHVTESGARERYLGQVTRALRSVTRSTYSTSSAIGLSDAFPDIYLYAE
jgi:hypothetical protein